VHWPQQGLTRIPGQSALQLGLLSTQQQQCDVLDIRSLLQATDSSAEPQADYILLLDKGRRGIACNRIEHIKTFDSDAIKWRQDRSQRPWFIGVINESMHSIVDLTALIAAFDNGEMA
jgi:purine-binding chemotaxis protein CheW